MEIKVYGPGCARCEETERLMKQVVKDMGIAATVEKISDFKEMMRLGIMSTPAVSIDGTVVCKGHVPPMEEIKDLLTGNDTASNSGGNDCCSCGGKC